MRGTAADSHPRGVAQARLFDKALVSLRRLKKSDIDAVMTLHRQLSDREQYFRFFTTHPPYLKDFAEKVVERTAENYAIGAFEDGHLIGVANYVRCDEPAVAEVALAVAHPDHLRGVATALLRHLADVAWCRGIEVFSADILAENGHMFQVLRDTGWPCAKQFDGAVLHVRIDLAHDEPRQRGTRRLVTRRGAT